MLLVSVLSHWVGYGRRKWDDTLEPDLQPEAQRMTNPPFPLGFCITISASCRLTAEHQIGTTMDDESSSPPRDAVSPCYVVLLYVVRIIRGTISTALGYLIEPRFTGDMLPYTPIYCSTVHIRRPRHYY